MRNRQPSGVSAEFVGNELEAAYAEVFRGHIVGGFHDGGVDITTSDEDVPTVQVKSSWGFARKFLQVSVQRRRFIPICVGEPADRQTVIDSLKQFGGFIGDDIPGDHGALLEGIAQVRSLCS